MLSGGGSGKSDFEYEDRLEDSSNTKMSGFTTARWI